MDTNPTHCQDILRSLDYDRYLANLYLPNELRFTAMVLDAFDAEMARIPKMVSDPIPGEIRLQWWREAIMGERREEANNNPQAAALLHCIDRHSLPTAAFERYLDARIFDLYQDPMPDMPTLEGYCGETSSIFFQLKMNILKGKSNTNAADLCGHAGMAAGITRILINLSFHHQTGRTYVPGDLIKAAGLTTKQWQSPQISERHATAISHLLETGVEYHNRVSNELRRSQDSVELSLFLQLAIFRKYLERAKEMGTSVFQNPPVVSGIKKHWILWRCVRKNAV